jgi:glycerol-3-phosphate dehydrogenase
VVPRARIGHKNAITFTSPMDGRVMFVLPWGEWSYVGTTDTDSPQSPDDVTVDEQDVTYLLRSANALFPGAHLTPDDVTASWAGLRPLIAANPSASTASVSREHRIVRGPEGVFTIAGGKLTTWRRMAAQLVDQVFRILPHHRKSRDRALSWTEPLPGGEAAALDGFRAGGGEIGLSGETVSHLVGRYGTEAPAIYNLCREDQRLAQKVHPDHPAIGAEVVFARQREFAILVEDVLERRLHLVTETRDHGEAARAAVAQLLARPD